jgi:hypothetical protein
MADHDAEPSGSGKQNSPPAFRSTGYSDVVEVRRLELLTPYMRSKCSTS